MIDLGLLMSIIVVFAAVSATERFWPLTTVAADHGFIDTVMWPAVAGLVTGRLATLLLDDRSSIGSLRDMAVIRSGVEFWPGLLAAAGLAAWAAHRDRVDGAARLADLAPITLMGYGGYEAACVFRDGCFGPLSSIGLRPDGLGARMFPMGIAMGLAAVAAAAATRRMLVQRRRASAVVAFSAASLGLIKAAGSIWLPHVGEGPTRQQATSIAVAVFGAMAYAAIVAVDQRSNQPVGVSP